MPRLKKKSYQQVKASNKDAMRTARNVEGTDYCDGTNTPSVKCAELNFSKKSEGLNFPKKSEGLNFPKKSTGLNFPKKSETENLLKDSEHLLKYSVHLPNDSETLLKDSESLINHSESLLKSSKMLSNVSKKSGTGSLFKDSKGLLQVSENSAEQFQEECSGEMFYATISQVQSSKSTSCSQTDYENNMKILHRSNPYSYTSLMQGSFHQGDKRFSVGSRGSQCTINSLCALIFAQYFDLLTPDSLDQVLTGGDQLYKSVVNSLKRCGVFKHRLLSLDEMPHEVNVKSLTVQIEKGNIVCGNAVEQFGNSNLPALHQSLYNAFQSANYLLIMIGAICSAVFYKDGLYWFFDSHSHGKDGLTHQDGKSIILSFGCIDSLVNFMYAMYDSMQIELYSQYELMSVKFTCLRNENFLLQKYMQDQYERVQCKHIQNVQRKESKDFDEWTYIKKTKRNRTNSSVPENYYSHDTRIKDEAKTFESNQTKNRKDYIKRYMHEKRKQSDFRETEKMKDKQAKQQCRQGNQVKSKEREAKKLTREDIRYRQAEQARDKKARQKNRLDEQVRTKEREAKKLTREDICYRQAEQTRDKTAKRSIRKNPYVLEKERISKQEFRRQKQNKDKEAHIDKLRRVSKRKKPDFRESEIECARKRKYGNNIEDSIKQFH